jgi:hypothetical protein
VNPDRDASEARILHIRENARARGAPHISHMFIVLRRECSEHGDLGARVKVQLRARVGV